MGWYEYFIWPVLVALSSGVTFSLSLFSIPITFKIYTGLLVFVWLGNVFFVITDSIALLTLCLLQVIAHALYLITDGKDLIVLSSVSFAIGACLNMWGDTAFEIVLLTSAVEVCTWIVSYFLLTLATPVEE